MYNIYFSMVLNELIFDGAITICSELFHIEAPAGRVRSDLSFQLFPDKINSSSSVNIQCIFA